MDKLVLIWSGDKQAAKQYGIRLVAQRYFVCRLVRNDDGEVLRAIRVIGFLDLAQAVEFLANLTKKVK